MIAPVVIGADLMKQLFYLICGSLCLILGIIGVFIPILPTTPFLLLASLCYMRSSKRLYDWLINHRVFGAYIYNYVTHKAISKKNRMYALAFLWTTLILSMLVASATHVSVILIVVGLGVTLHLMTLKSWEGAI
jgi:uncharacterized protein